MSSETKGKSFSRFIAVVIVGLAFVGSAFMVAQSEQSLFVDLPDMPVQAAELN